MKTTKIQNLVSSNKLAWSEMIQMIQWKLVEQKQITQLKLNKQWSFLWKDMKLKDIFCQSNKKGTW